MSSHDINGFTYVIGKLSARQQFDITRRLGFINFMLENEVEEDHTQGARWIGAMVTNSLANVPQQDMDFILDTCLGVVQVERNNKLRSMWNFQARAPQFEDLGIDMTVMLELVDLVIQENLSPFFEKLQENRQRVSQDQTTDPTNQQE